MSQCAIWGTSASAAPKTSDGDTIDSPRVGGKYFITGSAATLVGQLDDPAKARLTTWLVDQRLQGVPVPRLDSDTAAWAASLPPTPVSARLERLLLWLKRTTTRAGQRLRIANDTRELEALAWSESTSSNELWFLLDTLKQNAWVEAQVHSGGFDAKIIIGGYERLEQLSNRLSTSYQGFVAMWFSDEMVLAYDHGMSPAIVDAGYKPMRIDKKPHNNKIDDEIIAEIRRSKFLVADFTQGPDGARGGVYYEAGFAHGLDIPVIFTVREDLIGKTHFDTRQYAHILWKDPPDLRRQLADRISATLGDGPYKPRS
jgi:hypothetical protein